MKNYTLWVMGLVSVVAVIVGIVYLPSDGLGGDFLRAERSVSRIMVAKDRNLTLSSLEEIPPLVASEKREVGESVFSRAFSEIRDVFTIPDKKIGLKIETDTLKKVKQYRDHFYRSDSDQLISITGDLVTIHKDEIATKENHVHQVERYILDEKTKTQYRVKDIEGTDELLPTTRVTLKGYIATSLKSGEKEKILPYAKSYKTLIVSANQFSSKFGYSSIKNGRDILINKDLSMRLNYKGLVVLVDMSNGVATNGLPTPEQVKEMISPGKIAEFYKEQSFGKLTYNVDVTPWFSVPRESISISDAPEFLRQYIGQQGVDLNGYDQIVFVVIGEGYGASGGYAEVGKGVFFLSPNTTPYSIGKALIYFSLYLNGGSWANDYFYNQSVAGNFTPFQFVFIHEMGHTLGVRHDNGYECEGLAPIGRVSQCDAVEYKNYYSLMGDGWHGFTTHFSGFFKSILGWISPQNRVWVKNSGSYVVNPIEDANAKVLFIDLDNNGEPEYVVDTRKAIGFDIPRNGTVDLGGVFIYRTYAGGVGPGTFDWLPSRLVDANKGIPSGEDGWRRAVLSGGRAITDEALGVRISAGAMPNGSSLVQVEKLPAVCRTFNPGAHVYFDEFGPVDRDGFVSRGAVDEFGDLLLPITIMSSNDDYQSCYSQHGSYIKMEVDLDGEVQASWSLEFEPFIGDVRFSPLVIIDNPETLNLGLHIINVKVTNMETGLFSSAELPFTVTQ